MGAVSDAGSVITLSTFIYQQDLSARSEKLKKWKTFKIMEIKAPESKLNLKMLHRKQKQKQKLNHFNLKVQEF